MKTLVLGAATAVVLAAMVGSAMAGKRCRGSAQPVSAPAHECMESKDIVDTAVGAGKFKTLAAALKAAGLVDTLKGQGPFTVFAPTD
jgi:uncharacterized surface protein with fasciclin (FAS1) repeats